MGGMIRYGRLYACFARFSFSRALEFRFDFFFRVVMDLVYYAVNLAFYRVVYLHTDSIGGWSEAQAMVFVAACLVVDGLQMTFVSNNLHLFPRLVNRGDLDSHLVRPVSTLFVVSFRELAVNSAINLMFAFGVFGWAVASYPGGLGSARVALLLTLVVCGAVLEALVHFTFLLPVFWTHSSRGFEMVFHNLSKAMERPDRIFTGWVRRVLVTVLPFSVMVSFPARLALEAFDPGILAHFFGAIAVYFLFVLWAWRRGLKAYSSASS